MIAGVPGEMDWRPNTDEAGTIRLPAVPNSEISRQVHSLEQYAQGLERVTQNIERANSPERLIAKSFPISPGVAVTAIPISDPSAEGLQQWPGFGPRVIKGVVNRHLAPKMIINERIRDIGRYSNLSTEPYKPGWRIGLREGARSPNTTESREMREAENFILNCGVPLVPTERKEDGRGPIADWLNRVTRDLMSFDMMTSWSRKDNSGRVQAFWTVPAENVRLSLPGGYKGDPEIIAAIVNDTGMIREPLYRDTFAYTTQFPRNDFIVGDYGWPLVEQTWDVINGFGNALDINMATFDRSSVPNGMLVLEGGVVNDKVIDLLARQWTNMQQGSSKYWGLPVIQMPDGGKVSVLDLKDMKGKEVLYKDLINILIGVICMIWGFPVRRFGFHASGSHKDSEPPADQSTTLVGDDDPGLPVLLSKIELHLNEYILWTRWPNLRFMFSAKDPKSDNREYEQRRLARTFGEHRAEADLKPLAELMAGKVKQLEGDLGALLGFFMDNAPTDATASTMYQAGMAIILASIVAPDPEASGGKVRGPGGTFTATSAPKGSPVREKDDPAQSAAHGAQAGVRRDSRAEKDRAEANKPKKD